MAYPGQKGDRTIQPHLFAIPQNEISIETDQRFTPQSELEKVRKAFGGVIGLDPCSNPQRTVPSNHHITESDDCFRTDWTPFLISTPFVFMNPPYSGSTPFLLELCRYIDLGLVASAITLTLVGVLSNKSTQPLVQKYAIAICHPFGRINFVNGGKSNDRDVVYILWGSSQGIQLFKENMTGLISIIRK